MIDFDEQVKPSESGLIKRLLKLKSYIPDFPFEGNLSFEKILYYLSKTPKSVDSDTLKKKCILITADFLGIKEVTSTKYIEQEVIEKIFYSHRNNVRKELKAMSSKKLIRLGIQAEKWINKENIYLSKIGNDLLLELKNGEISGVAFFTASAKGVLIFDEVSWNLQNQIYPNKSTFWAVGSLIISKLNKFTNFIINKNSTLLVSITIRFILKYFIKLEDDYSFKQFQKIEREVGTIEDISQLMEDLNKYIENKDKTVEEVKNRIWFQRIQKYMEKKNVHIR